MEAAEDTAVSLDFDLNYVAVHPVRTAAELAEQQVEVHKPNKDPVWVVVQILRHMDSVAQVERWIAVVDE